MRTSIISIIWGRYVIAVVIPILNQVGPGLSSTNLDNPG